MIWMLLFLLVGIADARRVSLEGIGISIRYTDQTYRYKSDHLDSDSWDLGRIFPKSSIPSQVSGNNWEYATHDFRPASDDSRINDRIQRIKADAAGDLLIAMPSAAASGDGWVRLNPGVNPDYYLDKIGRNTGASPDLNSPYWFYKLPYPAPGVWVALPVNSLSTPRPPFVFARKRELYWENPPQLMAHASIIATKNEGGGNTTVANPNLLIRPNGDYLASISGASGATGVWKSTDRGVTWTYLASNLSVNRTSIFEHQGAIYLIGWNTSGGGTRIYKSADNGISWTSSVFAGGGGGDAPSHVDVVNGRIWKAATVTSPFGTAPGLMSAPVNADLMVESNWSYSAPGATWGAKLGTYTLANGQKATVIDEPEGTLLTTKEGRVVNATKSDIYRPADGITANGIAMISADRGDVNKTAIDPDYAGPRLPGSGSKYTVRYDPVSDQYWALTSGGTNRGQLNLYSAGAAGGRIGDFRFRGRILEGHSTSYHGFNYPFLLFDGADIVFTLRTGWDHSRGTSDRWHDADLFTFHRIPNFRNLGTPNYVCNPGFEDDMAGWLTKLDGDEDADFTEAANPDSGARDLIHSKASAYKVNTYRTVGLPNGTYSASVRVRSGGGQKECYFYVNGYGGPEKRANIQAGSTYTKIELTGIVVTNGACDLGFYSDANAGNWMTADDVELFDPATVGSSSVWTGPAGGSWAAAGNWLNGVIASGPGGTADFNTLTMVSNLGVSLDGARTIGQIIFGDAGGNHNWTLNTGSGGPLTLDGAATPVITVNNGGSNMIDAVLAGTQGMIKNGPGLVGLTAVNTYLGPTVVDGGVLLLNHGNTNPSTLNSSASLTINAGGTVQVGLDNSLAGSTSVIGTLPVTINAGGLLTGSPQTSQQGTPGAGTSAHIRGLLTLNGGILSNSGNSNQLKWGSWDLDNGVAVNTGPNNSNSSTIECDSVIPSQTGGTIFNINPGGAPGGIDLLVSGTLITGSTGGLADTGIVKTGAGTMVLAAANTYLRPTVVSNGALLVNGSTAGGSVVTVRSGGTLGGTGSIGGAVTFEAGSSARLAPGSPLALSKSLTVATAGTLPVVKVDLANDTPSGSYPLAVYNSAGSSGTFDSVPVIASGSLASGTAGAITTGGGWIRLVVTPSPIMPEFVNIPKIVAGAFQLGLSFGRPVTGVDPSDFAITNATLDTITAVGDDYVLGLTPVAPGTVGVQLTAGGITDSNGQVLNASVSASTRFTLQLLILEAAEASYIGGGMVLTPDAAAPHGVYLSLPDGAYPGNYNLPVTTPHRAEYVFVIPQPGQWMLRGLIRSADNSSDSFWVEIDGNQALGTVYQWNTGPVGADYPWDFLSNAGGPDPVTLNFTAGLHTVTIYGRDDGTRLDRLELLSVRPLVSLAGPSAVVNGDYDVTARFSESVTGLSPGDFIITGGSVVAVDGSGADFIISVKPTAGTITLALAGNAVFDAGGAGNYESNTIRVTYRSAYEQWALDYGVDGTPASMKSDADHDGVCQLLEFAFNLNPNVPDGAVYDPAVDPPSGLPRLVVIPAGPAGRTITLQYLRRQGIPELIYHSEFGSSPEDFADSGSIAVVDDLAPAWPGWQRVTVSEAIPAGDSKRFGRVRVTLNQP